MRSVSSLLVSALVAAGVAVAAPSAHAAPTDAQALVAIQKTDPATGAIEVNVPSHAGTRAAVVAKRTSGPAAGVRDLWLVGPGSTATALTDYRDTITAASSGMDAPSWSVDDSKVAVTTSDPSDELSTQLHVWNASPTPTVFASIPGSAAGQFTADGRYLTVPQISATSFGESALDLNTAELFAAWTFSASNPQIVASPACARTHEPGYQPGSDSDDLLIRWLTGPDYGCTFGSSAVGPTPTPGTTPTPTPRPAATPMPTATPTPPPSATPTLPPGSGTTPLSTTPSPLYVVSFARSLRAARSRGLRVKVQVPEAVRLKAWLLGPDGKTIGRCSKQAPAGAFAFTLPLATKSKRALRKRRSLVVTVRLLGTVDGRYVTVDQKLTLTGG